QQLEGYSGTVRYVMNRYAEGGILDRYGNKAGKIYGPLSQLISVDDKYVTAIETALAANLQFIVVENDAVAKAYVRMSYKTGDAMGMNMATIASEAASKIIEEATGLRLIASSGNMCCDKKPAAINAVEGRGKTVSAGVFLSDELIRTVLKTEARLLIEVNMRKNLVGSARAGALGFNAHAANVVAALFLACGQDAAHVVEGGNCITTAEAVDGGVYVSVTLPSLQVGTVGGGTSVACQNECLRMLDCAGDGKAMKFAEIAASAVLAGELSLLSALAAGQLGKAHKELGRG
ncbi:MAG TPA: hypothetical protein O0X17_03480, partial [Methanocorpusculum sp.]|nr:hypothetical protein [Methanocorpusculum sp.]